LSRTSPTRTRVYGRWRLVRPAAVPAFWLTLVMAGASTAQIDLDCSRLQESRSMIGRLELAEIEGAEDIHRAKMGAAFGGCRGGAAGGPCRAAERDRYGAEWEGQKRRIQAKYGAMRADLERRCRTTPPRADAPRD